ncbi:hypothetical protein K439DRAFT_1334285 [Ramaria rubella]|nr:hypothetical protein K439DRAFT_1334285 [Ramaria rubella]
MLPSNTTTSILLAPEVTAALTPKSIACLERLLQYEPPPVDSRMSSYPSSMHGAVLVLLYEKAGSLRVLLTTRSKLLRSHPFETAFPGGKIDNNDDGVIAAAFREANEEVGLPVNCSDILVLCRLQPFVSLFKILVTPVVALLTNLSVLESLTPSPEEVDHIFDHPLEAILDPNLAANEPLSLKGEANWPYTTDFYSTSDSTNTIVRTYRMHRFRSCYTPVKGLTADILIAVAQIAYNRETSYEQFAPGQLNPAAALSVVLENHLYPDVTRSTPAT